MTRNALENLEPYQCQFNSDAIFSAFLCSTRSLIDRARATDARPGRNNNKTFAFMISDNNNNKCTPNRNTANRLPYISWKKNCYVGHADTLLLRCARRTRDCVILRTRDTCDIIVIIL